MTTYAYMQGDVRHEPAPRHLMAVATAFRDMEMLMINNGHSGSTNVNCMLPVRSEIRSSEVHAAKSLFQQYIGR